VIDLVAGPLHDDVTSIGFLLGTWRGEGEGGYPTIAGFRYGEEITFEHVGEPFLLYGQRSWSLDDGAPLHLERGFLRLAGTGRVELTLAHPLGLTEVSEGDLDDRSISVATGTVGRTRTGSAVTAVRRRYRVDDEVLSYELDMEMDGVPMTRHLAAQLRRVSR
jgi:hypothetical protein